MDIIDTAVRVGKLIYRPRESLHSLGAFLCREDIAALERDLASVKARLVERDRELDELHRKEIKEATELAALRALLDFRDDYRRVAIATGATVYALRKGCGTAPRLVCPVCFERGVLADICVKRMPHYKVSGRCYKAAHVTCPTSGCSYKFTVLADLLERFNKLVD